MNRQSSSSFSGKLTVVALLDAAAGIAVQIVSGVDYPTVPPGLIILLAASGIVAFGPWRWTPMAGVLLDPSRLGVFTGFWIQFLAVIAAVVGGTAATVRNFGFQHRGAG
jgi:hypothetical protein